MKSTVAVIAAILLSAAPSLAAEPRSTSKREAIDCMKRQFSVNKNASYVNAAKACRDEIRSQRPDAAVATVAKSEPR
jgi:hypothetical protein